MSASITNYGNYKTLPISFTGRWLAAGNDYLPLNYSNRIAKSGVVVIRGFVAGCGVIPVAATGVICHVVMGIWYACSNEPIKAQPDLKTVYRKEFCQKSWQHFNAAAVDAKAFVKGVFMTALAVSIPAAAVFGGIQIDIVPYNILPILGALVGILASYKLFSTVNPIFRYMNFRDEASNYFPEDLANQASGLDAITRIITVELIGRLSGTEVMAEIAQQIGKISQIVKYLEGRKAKMRVWSQTEQKEGFFAQTKEMYKVLLHLKMIYENEPNDLIIIIMKHYYEYSLGLFVKYPYLFPVEKEELKEASNSDTKDKEKVNEGEKASAAPKIDNIDLGRWLNDTIKESAALSRWVTGLDKQVKKHVDDAKIVPASPSEAGERPTILTAPEDSGSPIPEQSKKGGGCVLA